MSDVLQLMGAIIQEGMRTFVLKGGVDLMTTKYSLKRNQSVTIIFIFSLVILIISCLYLTERNKYVNEREKLEKVNMYLYELEVKNPLVVISFFLGQQPVESVNWDEEVFRKDLQSIFRNLDNGITNVDYFDPQIVPNAILLQLHHLQEKVGLTLMNINREKPLDEETKVEIMNLSKSVYLCEINEITSSWGQVELKLECLNEAIDK